MQDTALSTVFRIIPSGRIHLCVDSVDLANSRDLHDLPARPITALAQDAHGYLWLGTQHGPVLFDGLVGAVPPALATLQGCFVRRFCFVGDRVLWMGTVGQGLVLVALGMAGPQLQQRLTQAHGLPDNTIRTLSADERGTVWVGTKAGIAVVEHGAVVRCIGERDGLPASEIRALCHDSLGRLWIGTENGLAVIVGGNVDRSLLADQDVAGGPVQSLALDREGKIWVGLRNGNLLRAEPGSAGAVRVVYVSNCGSPVDEMCTDRLGRLWLGTRQGAYVYSRGVQCDAFGHQDGLPVTGILSLHADPDGRVWAGTDAGLALLVTTSLPARALGGPNMPDRTLAWAFLDNGSDQLWLGTADGLRGIDKSAERRVAVSDLPAVLQQETVWSLCTDQLGLLWVGVRRQGVYCLQPATVAARAHLLDESAADVPCMCTIGPHQLWIATERQGLFRIDVRSHQITAAVGSAQGMPDTDIRSLVVDQRGRLWAGTVSGRVVCIDPERACVLCTLAVGLDTAPAMVLGLVCDAQGWIWACTGGAGLVCIDPEQMVVVRTVTTADGLRSNWLYSCQTDQKGRLWLSSTRGVLRFCPKTGQCIALDQSLGLPDDDCNSNALRLDASGWLWVGTARGVGIVDTTLVPDDVSPCSVYLTSFRVLGQPCDFVPGMELEDSAYDLQFEYGAVSFVAPAMVQYRVQLVGLETGWSAPTFQRLQRYTNLQPGSYCLRVSACNWGGRWSEPLEAAFRIILDRRTQAVEEARERERLEAEQLRTELLSRSQAQAAAALELAELRSTFVASVSHELRTPLTAIVGYAELLQAHWTQLDDVARLDRINRIVTSARRQQRLVEELLLLSRLEMGALVGTTEAALLARLVERAVEEVRVAYHGQQIGTQGPADLAIRADPDRTVQILVNLIDNAAKYSPEGAPIMVTWARDASRATVLVRDRGAGIPAEGRERLFTRFGRVPGSRMRAGHVGTGLGLYLGRSLARAMDGELDLASTDHSGSVFRLSLPAEVGLDPEPAIHEP